MSLHGRVGLPWNTVHLCAAPFTAAAMQLAAIDSASCRVSQGPCPPSTSGVSCCGTASVEAVHWRKIRTAKVQQQQQQQAVQRRGAGLTCPLGPRCPGAGARHDHPRCRRLSPAAALHPCTRERTRAAPPPHLHRQAVVLHAAYSSRARHPSVDPSGSTGTRHARDTSWRFIPE